MHGAISKLQSAFSFTYDFRKGGRSQFDCILILLVISELSTEKIDFDVFFYLKASASRVVFFHFGAVLTMAFVRKPKS